MLSKEYMKSLAKKAGVKVVDNIYNSDKTLVDVDEKTPLTSDFMDYIPESRIYSTIPFKTKESFNSNENESLFTPRYFNMKTNSKNVVDDYMSYSTNDLYSESKNTNYIKNFMSSTNGVAE